mmetsp:Transcript_30045/g.70175  ORF Transcript_30045/g.70175 Transcript_30045/m.70175 type:complete len:208 (-) Transcript_30045:286-909(-)
MSDDRLAPIVALGHPRRSVPTVELDTPRAPLEGSRVGLNGRVSLQLITREVGIVRRVDVVVGQWVRHVLCEVAPSTLQQLYGVVDGVFRLVQQQPKRLDSQIGRVGVLRQPPDLRHREVLRHGRPPPLLPQESRKIPRVPLRLAAHDSRHLLALAEHDVHHGKKLLLVKHVVAIRIVCFHDVFCFGLGECDVERLEDLAHLFVRERA